MLVFPARKRAKGTVWSYRSEQGSELPCAERWYIRGEESESELVSESPDVEGEGLERYLAVRREVSSNTSVSRGVAPWLVKIVDKVFLHISTSKG